MKQHESIGGELWRCDEICTVVHLLMRILCVQKQVISRLLEALY